jgi:asparagine synthase (glutamine-hydrolysing)
MEYILSNFPIQNGTEYKGVFYQGPFSNNLDLRLTDGEIYNYEDQHLRNFEIDEIEKLDLTGLFTFICYKPEASEIFIKNDILGEIPTYYYYKEDKFMISNNPWKILSNLDKEDIIIDPLQLYLYLYYLVQPTPKKTYFKNLNILPNATILSVNLQNNMIKEQEYWEFDNLPKRDITLEEAMNEFDSGLNEFFDYVLKVNSGKQFGFGNSGGLDSRLVAIYAKKKSFRVKGITIAEIHPRWRIKSNTVYQAGKIAKKCGVESYFVDYTAENYDMRNLLDIRNNLFGSSQIFKNPIEKIPKFDIMLTGHEGLLIGSGYGPAIANITPSLLPDAMIGRYKNFDALNPTKSSFWEKLRKSLEIMKGKRDRRFDEFNEENITKNIQLKQNIFDQYFNKTQIEEIHDAMRNFVRKYQKKYSPLNVWRVFFLKQAMRFNYLGGFESLNRTKKAYYIYYPFVFSYLETWPREYLDDRFLLKKFLKLHSPDIARIPGQDMEPIDIQGEREKNAYKEIQKRIKQIYKKIALKIRKKGLDYLEWVKNPGYQEYAHRTLERSNPFFQKYVDLKKLVSLNIYNYKSLVCVVKIKRIFDILYYNEMHLFDREYYQMN